MILTRTAAALVLGTTLCASQAYAQSTDALIDKLVRKGILTTKEGNELRDDSDKNFNQAYSIKSGMPDWVTAVKINGDMRARYDGVSANANYKKSATGVSTNSFTGRDRFRYRLRLGVVATIQDQFEVGLKLTSDDAANGGSGGDPISGNTTFQDNGSKKLIYIDQAYGKWSPNLSQDLSSSFTVGKMENPFVIDDMVFDPDYTPEGLGVQTAYKINDKHSLKVNGGGFVLDESSGSTKDPYLVGGQIRWDAAWNKKISTTAGVTALALGHAPALTTASVPDSNKGNTRNASGALIYSYNPVVLDGGITYTLDSFPLYKGAFPIKASGEYMNNPAAPSSADNYAWNTGITFGKSGKKGTWDLNYTYKWLGANAWYEELVDSDFGAVYDRSYASSGMSAPGYAAGTNTKGHIVRFAYSPTDALTLAVKWFHTDLANDSHMWGKDGGTDRIQVDGSLKF